MRNRTEHGFSRLTAISDAGSTPAASTNSKQLIISGLLIRTENLGQNCTVTVQSPFRICPNSAIRAESR
jgi:hypothetical protein